MCTTVNQRVVLTLSKGGQTTFFIYLLVLMCNPSPLKSPRITFVELAPVSYPLAMLALLRPQVLDSEHTQQFDR